MKHYVFSAEVDRVGPGGMSMFDWFMGYRWDNSGALWVPFPQTLPTTGVPGTLWFFVDGVVAGLAPVTYVQHDDMNEREEVWYLAEQVHKFGDERPLPKAHVSSTVLTGEEKDQARRDFYLRLEQCRESIAGASP